MTILLLVISAALAGMAVTLMSNWWSFPYLQRSEATADGPFVSVLVPARNEAAGIAATVRQLLRQSYPHYELLLLDDHSADGTAAVAKEGAEGDNRLKILQGRPLPPGWLGKTWACAQLAAQAKGEILVFTDADVGWQPDALAALVCEIERRAADMLAVWPTQRTVTWAERLCVPLMALAVHAYLPVLGVHHTPFALLAAANGQCIAFRRRAYSRICGHAAVRDSVLEDVSLARRAKAAGLRLRMAEADNLISCRMYSDWPSVRDGFAKSILAGFSGVAGLIAGTVFHWLVFLVPWLLLFLGLASDGSAQSWRAGARIPVQPLWALLLILAGLLLRGLTAWRSGQRPGSVVPICSMPNARTACGQQRPKLWDGVDALLLPVSVLLMTVIAARALWWQWRYGGPLWKGRVAQPGSVPPPL